MQSKDNRTAIFAIVFIVIGLAIVTLITLLFNRQSSSVDRISINNYGSYVKNIDSSEREIIENTLYTTVLKNGVSEDTANSISDAVIRTDSYTQEQSNKIYTTTFIVDIESIKQSYKIRDLFSYLSVEESNLYDYTTLALCLDPSDLKYGDFSCKDRNSQEAGVSESDPIIKYLPNSTLEYTLDIDNSSEDLKLIATLNLTGADYNSGEKAAIKRYKQAITTWFASKNLNIDNYSITYKY